MKLLRLITKRIPDFQDVDVFYVSQYRSNGRITAENSVGHHGLDDIARTLFFSITFKMFKQAAQ